MRKFGEGDRLLLVDGSGYIFRAYFSSLNVASDRFRYRSDNTPVGAVHIFCHMLMTDVLQSPRKPTHIAVVFDKSSITFRSEIYPPYKANRPPPPEDLVPQFASTREATRAFNIPCLEMEGYEADDIIATLAKQGKEAGGEVTIISSDKDLMQLVGDGIVMYDTRKRQKIGPEEVKKKFQVYPDRVIDIQALMGDSSDNIPGVPGVGPKTAAGLINEYGDLDTLLQRLEEIKKPKLRQVLEENAANVQIYRQLVTLHQNVPIDVTLEDLELAPPEPKPLFDFLLAQEFRTLVLRAAEYLKVDPPELPARNLQEGTQPEKLSFKPTEFRLVNSMEGLNDLVARIYERGQVAISFETEGEESTADLIALGLAVQEQETYYLPLKHVDTKGLLRTDGSKFPNQVSVDTALETLQPMFEDRSILKIGQNIKFLVKILARKGIRLKIVDDIQVMSFVAKEGNYKFDLAKIAENEFGFKPTVLADLLGSGKKAIPYSHSNIDDAAKYSATNADIILRVWKLLRPQLIENKVSTVYETLEKPLIGILAEMEETGIVVDPNKLKELSAIFESELAELAAKIHDMAGEEFLISSPKQLGTVLFDKLELPSDKARTATGYKTGVDILENLTDRGYELPGLVLEWRHKAKLKSTYTDALQTCINPSTGRVHTSYRLDGANTGRLSSINPNLQNIPIRTREGKQIREAFVAREGYEIVSLDYSQIELRILAYMANVKGMKEAFREKMDIHYSTASQVFETPLEEVTPEMRRKAKAINFGIIYGISAFGLARNLQIPRKDASEFIKGYFERYPEIKIYMDKIVGIAEQQNHVKTLFGRKVGTPSINKSGPQKAFAKRAAINAPIQGSAADIIRRAMVRIPDVISKLPGKMLLQIHDELLFEVRQDAVPDLIAVATKSMEKADHPVIAIEPGLVVDSGVGKNWLEAH